MTVKSETAWSGLVVTKDATGALATPSVGPAGVLYVDGTADAATVTISGSNPYKWTVTLPTLTAGQTVSMYITATIATIATASVVAEDVADTVALSDVNTALATVDGIVDALALVAPDNKPTVAATGEATTNVTYWAGVAVAAADASGYINVLNVIGNVDGTVGEIMNFSATAQQASRDAMKLAPTAGAPAAGSVDAHLDALALEATAQAVLAAIGGQVVEGAYTRDEILRIVAAALAGATSGSGTDTVEILGLDGVTTRITATLDGSGNRTGMTLDGEVYA